MNDHSNYIPSTTYELLENRHVTLLELLDRIVDKGVMVKGEILLSVADVDLIYLNLELLLSSVKTVVHAARTEDGSRYVSETPQPPTPDPIVDAAPPEVEDENASPPEVEDVDIVSPEVEGEDVPPSAARSQRSSAGRENEKNIASDFSSPLDFQQNRRPGPRANIDPKNVEKGLVKLVLTLVDLLRQLMEKQAIRRIEDEQLDGAEIEKVGNAFYLLNEKIEQLKETFDIADEELNIDLGPLGELL